MYWIKENWREILINLFIMVVVFSIGFGGGYLWNKKEIIEKKEKEILTLKQKKEEEQNKIKKEREKKEEIKKKFENLNLQANGVLVKNYMVRKFMQKIKIKFFPLLL